MAPIYLPTYAFTSLQFDMRSILRSIDSCQIKVSGPVSHDHMIISWAQVGTYQGQVFFFKVDC